MYREMLDEFVTLANEVSLEDLEVISVAVLAGLEKSAEEGKRPNVVGGLVKGNIMGTLEGAAPGAAVGAGISALMTKNPELRAASALMGAGYGAVAGAQVGGLVGLVRGGLNASNKRKAFDAANPKQASEAITEAIDKIATKDEILEAIDNIQLS